MMAAFRILPYGISVDLREDNLELSPNVAMEFAITI